jgi:hypothetical protein
VEGARILTTRFHGSHGFKGRQARRLPMPIYLLHAKIAHKSIQRIYFKIRHSLPIPYLEVFVSQKAGCNINISISVTSPR